MKKILYSLLTLLPALLNVACESGIDLDLPEYQRKLVINGFFSPDSAWKIGVSHSTGILSLEDPGAVENARITITDGSNTYNLQPAGQPGVYSLPGVYPVENHSYRLQVSAPGFPDVQAGNHVPSAVRLISMDTLHYAETDKYGYKNKYIQLSLLIRDNPGEDNYYQIGLYNLYHSGGRPYYSSIRFSTSTGAFLGEAPEFGETGVSFFREAVFSDELFDGEDYRIILKEIDNYNPADERYVAISSVSRAYYLYVKNIHHSENDDLSFFSEAQPYHGNIRNGLGVFAGFNTRILPMK